MRTFGNNFIKVFLSAKIYESEELNFADPGGRAVQGVGLNSLACSDWWYESRRGRGYLSLESVVCCTVEVSATNRSPVQRSPTICVCVIEYGQMKH